MLDHPRIAVVTADLVPTSTTERDRRIAPPVKENQRLLALLQPLLDRAA
jgi:predicted protein tyrosine phosphatase